MSNSEDKNRIISFILNRAALGDISFLVRAYEKRTKRGTAAGNMELHKIAGKNELLWAVDYILKVIPDDELALVKGAIERRVEKKEQGGLHAGLAKGIASGMGVHLGQAYDAVHRGARMLAADIILQHNPYIPEDHLKLLLDTWVPSPGQKKSMAPLPADVMLAMVEQFIAYATGTIKKEELDGFPKGWADKYWDAFSSDMRGLIAKHLHNEIDKEAFWKGMEELIKRG